MDAQTPNRISVTFNLTFWERFIAAHTVIRYHWALIATHAVFPLGGLAVLVLPLFTGVPVGLKQIALALICFSFTPLMTALALWRAGRIKMAQGPLTYSFDADGLCVNGPAFNTAVKWSAITRVRRSARFLFLFISTTRAFCVPLKVLADQGLLQEVCALTREHTNFR